MTSTTGSMHARAQKLRALQQAIHDTFAKRRRSAAEWAAWERACSDFKEAYDHLFYPGGWKQLEALAQGAPEDIDTALDYLEADPIYFRSGYLKEWIWKRLARCSLSRRQRSRLESIALAYTQRRIRREFWYMCRTMAQLGSEEFWEAVQREAAAESARPAGLRASYLAAYAQGIPAGERVRQRVLEDILRERYATA